MSRGTREHQLLVTKISDTRLSRSVVVLSRFVLLSFHLHYMGPTTPPRKARKLEILNPKFETNSNFQIF